ncbi:hypothetical protein ACFQLX_16615 [Streptomyces polyrhachis]|uniref:Uncharacterized protein n=1 Tax=Streptomyces polyrhachis TaxID=1282885 RepID=A0ABW2GGA1_9ACTN
MTQAAQRKKSRARTEHRFFNAQGAEVKTRDEAFAALAADPVALSTPCRLELHAGSVTFAIDLTYNPTTYPHAITGGQITAGICGAPWEVTGGFLGEQLRLDARKTGQGSCASTITIVGEYQNPPAYRGTYGFDGATSSFKHTTRYEC